MKKKVKKFLKNLGVKAKECPRCKKLQDENLYWVSVYKNKEGYMCHVCNEWFHVEGDKMLGEVTKDINELGVQVMQAKEKFGIFWIYADLHSLNLKRLKQMDRILQSYKKKYPELTLRIS